MCQEAVTPSILSLLNSPKSLPLGARPDVLSGKQTYFEIGASQQVVAFLRRIFLVEKT